jgi:hypothetical protein
MRSAQSIFEETATALYRQGKAALAQGTIGCAYRTPDGRKCAMGFHIPDEQYRASLEGSAAEDVIRSLGLDLDPILMGMLQRTHDRARRHPDTAEFIDVWEPGEYTIDGDHSVMGGIAWNLWFLGNLMALETRFLEGLWPRPKE